MELIRTYVFMLPYLGAPMNRFPPNGLWMFFIMLHRYMVFKMLKCEKGFFVTSSLRYSIRPKKYVTVCTVNADTLQKPSNFTIRKFTFWLQALLHIEMGIVMNNISLLPLLTVSPIYDMLIMLQVRMDLAFKFARTPMSLTNNHHSGSRK